MLLLLQNLLAENGDEEEEEQKEDVEDVRVVMRAFDDALFIVDTSCLVARTRSLFSTDVLGYTRQYL